MHVCLHRQHINGYPVVGLAFATCAAVAPPSPVTLFLLKRTQLVLCGLQSQCNHIEINPTMKMQGDWMNPTLNLNLMLTIVFIA